MGSIIDKVDLGKIIAKDMTIQEQPELFLDWVKRSETSMEDVLKWATEDQIKKCNESYSSHN